jgi:hypothetical protein
MSASIFLANSRAKVNASPFSGFGLETLELEMNRAGIKVNAFMQTSRPNVYACGDITGFSLLAHTAVSEAELAIKHILGKAPQGINYLTVPGVVYTNPEVAGVGKTEEQLQQEGVAYTSRKLPMAFSGRFVAENEQGNGLCKILLSADGTILGAHLLGNPASELIVNLGTPLFDGGACRCARGRGRCGARTEGFCRFGDRAFALDYEHLEKIVMIPAYLTNSFYPFEGERAIVGACMTSPCLRGVIHFLQGTRKELQKWQTSSLRRNVRLLI